MLCFQRAQERLQACRILSDCRREFLNLALRTHDARIDMTRIVACAHLGHEISPSFLIDMSLEIVPHFFLFF